MITQRAAAGNVCLSQQTLIANCAVIINHGPKGLSIVYETVRCYLLLSHVKSKRLKKEKPSDIIGSPSGELYKSACLHLVKHSPALP